MSEALYLLDTSALLTLIEDEAGAARVEEVLRTQAAIITWMSLLEVAYITQQERGVAEAERRYALIKALSVTLIWQVEEATLLTAARLKAVHRLSLADTIIAAYTMQAKAILLHKDPEFEALTGQVGLEALPYKTAEPEPVHDERNGG
jgi:predicted nucleic acid-binding protein